MLTDRSRIARPVRGLALCSSLAIATALLVGPGLAQAQSFQGTGTVVAGSATITTATNSTTIGGISTDAVIDWTTFDTATGGGPINFQPSGTTATFTSTNDFSVLNRIIPTDPSRAIQFNGTIIGQIQSTTTIPGGDVYFYSPGGVIVGSTAVFNVGNLGLTSIAPAVVGGQFVQGATTEFVQFNGAVTPGSSVTIQPGAQINAGNAGNQGYVTIVAPVIDQRGTINTNGGAALISADAATITFNPTGLFDIQVTSGTSGTGTTLFNNGTITGPAFSGTGINHRIYMVAVPKNTAITMAIAAGSTLGFDVAGAANTVGNAVVLSGGFDIVAGQAAATPSAGGGTGQVDTFANPTSITSALSVASTGRALLFANSGQVANYASNVAVSGATPGTSPTTIAAQVGSFGAGSQINIVGNLSVTALDPTIVAPTSGLQVSNFAVVDATGGGHISIGGSATLRNDKFNPLGSATPGQARIAVNGGSQLTIGGGALLTANSTGTGGGTGTGGQTLIDSRDAGSLISITGATTLNALGLAAPGATPGTPGGNATGGVAIIQALSGGDVSITGPVNVNAFGGGGAGNAAAGGTGTGGLAQIFARDSGSSVSINGLANVFANGVGGAGTSANGGIGTGGQAFVNAQVAGPASVSISGVTAIQAIGQGGTASSGSAGAGFGGNAVAAASVGNNVSFGNNLDVLALGIGGNATGGNAGSATGGTARVTLFSGGTMSVGGNVLVHGLGLAGIGNPDTAVATGNLAAVSVQQNSVLNVTGSLQASSAGLGDRSAFMVASSGAGIGGTTTVDSFLNGAINVGGVLRARSEATATNGRNATGGPATVAANSGGDITANQLNISTDGVGGNDTGTGAGFGRGGTASLIASGAGSTVSIANGNSTGVANLGELDFLSAEGFGGQTNTTGGTGGTGTGGTAAIFVQAGGTLSGPANTGTQGFVRLVPRGIGGNANADNATGGQAIGGTVNIVVDGGMMTSARLLISSEAVGGSATGAAVSSGLTVGGGNATGGSRNITVTNVGSLTTSFNGTNTGAAGGNGSDSGRGGDASGGTANLTIDNSSTVTLTGSSSLGVVNSSGGGGASGMSGNATGGSTFARVANGSTLTMSGPTTNSFILSAAASGTLSPTASLTSGDSTGGNSTFVIENATANLQRVSVSATGGSFGLVGQGGTGTGGNATIQLIGATLTADSVIVSAVGSGGSLDIGQSGVAGNGIGGLARLIATGGSSTATVAQSIGIGADGLGGNIGGAAGTTTGNGIGGNARLAVNSGATLTLNTPTVEVVADGEGGEVVDGSADIGGFGTGGQADVFANGGTITINGDLFLEADNDGGDGQIGGAGLRRTDGFANAILRAQNGSITVTGTTGLASVGEGGNGARAEGGLIVVDAQNSLAGPSTITLNGLVADAIAVGGAGGFAPSPTAPGGTGGDAFGGGIVVLGSAGNGNLVVNGASFLDASAFGGTGGTGHPGGEAAGTNGGRGGNATGGNIQFGMKSHIDTGSLNVGSAQFGAVRAAADATGGNGGLGGSGTTQGVGGDGGDAFGGGATLLVRGSPVTITGTTILGGDADGGEGGGLGVAGATVGAGGDATVGNAGGVAILATSRFMQPTQRGTLTAGTIVGTAIATPGPGATEGASIIGSQPLLLEFSSASGSVASIDMVAEGDNLVGALPSRIMLTDGTLDVSGALSVSTGDALSVTLDSFTVNVANLSLEAENFVLAATRPAMLGTFNVSGSLNVFSGLDFLAYANFDFANGFFSFDGSFLSGDLISDDDLFIDALGSITTGNVSADQVGFSAGTNLATGAVVSGDYIELEAGGTATTGQLTGGGDVQVSAGGAVTVAGASAGIVNPSTDPETDYTLVLRSLTSIVAGNLTARGNVGLGSPGSITVGNVTTGSAGRGFLALAGTGLTTGAIDTSASANGGLVYLANFSMEPLGGELANEFNPDPILAATPVAIGGPISLGGAVSTGRFQAATTGAFSAQAISAPNLFQLSAGADVTLGDISSLIVNVSSAASLTTGAVTSTATAAQLAALSQSNGVILTAANTLTTGAIQAGGGVDLNASGAVAVGTVNAGTSIEIDAGLGITGAAMVAGGLIEAEAGGAIQLGNLTAGQSVNLDAGGTLTAGNITAGPDPITQFSMGLVATGNISLGNLTGSNSIGIVSELGSITAGSVTAGRSLLALASGAVGFGGVTTGATANDFLYIANSSMVSLGGPLNDDFNPAPIYAATPVATTGPITINGAVSTGNLIAATTGALSIGGGTTPANISLAGRLQLAAGGPLALGNVDALNIRLQSGATITGGSLTSRDAIAVSGTGAVTLGNLSAGIANPTTSGVARDIGVASTGGSLTVGTVAAGADVRFDAGGGNLAVGTITAGDDVLLLARDSVTTGAISGSTSEGRITIANASLRSLDPIDVDSDLIFNAAPAAVSGAISIGGPVSGTTFTAAANGNFTAGAMTLGQSIRINRAALLQVDGAWVAPTINLASQRIAFGTASGTGIGGTGTTNLTLRALASGQTAVLGGTTAGSGYTLTQADFARIRAGNLMLQVDRQGASGGAPDLEIRDLTLNGSAGSGFAATTITTPGRIRVTGDLVLQQAGAMDTLNVNATDRLEIVLPEGSIAITGTGGTLAGTLTLSSNNLVAGTLDILQQVMADPEAAGLAEALKTPASTTSNLAGYIRAEGVKLLSNANILLQNSGTARDFAGVTVGGGGLIIGRISPASGGTTGGGSTGGGTTSTTGFSFTGMLTSPNEILLFEFRVDANSEVTLRTYSYAGGTNAAGQVIPAGGFDPILALFDAAGALIGQNDDGGSNVPADPATGSRFDTFFQPSAPLSPGTYTVSVSVFSNFANGPNLSNGFEMNETSFGSGRSANFAFDVLGAATATGPGSMTPTSSGPLNVIGFGRQQTATGTTTGEVFFTGINFGTGGANPLVYTDLSQFNTCLVNGGTCSSLVPMNTPLAPPASEITVVIATPLAASPPPPSVEDSGPGDSSSGASESEAADESDSGEGESQDEDESDGEGEDEAASPIAPPTPLISTRALDGDVTVVEPVSGAGNPALFGSAVDETTVQGETP